jgi:hypothetical protein
MNPLRIQVKDALRREIAIAEPQAPQDTQIFDIILDDGDHKVGAFQKTFEHLFLEFLKPGGLYS